jgi:diaminopimelate decarboxylase
VNCHAASPPVDPTAATPGAELQERLVTAARTFGTPLYVVDVSALARAAAVLEEAFPAPWVRQYSLKANDLPAITDVLSARGWGANVVSAGEWACARAAGIDPAVTTLEGVGKSDADLLDAVDAAASGQPLRWVAVESADELRCLGELHRRRRDQVGHDIDLGVLLRLNPDVQPETSPGLAVGLAVSKFGLSPHDLVSLAAGPWWQGGLRLRGIHVHMGSHLGDVVAWALAGRRAVELLARVCAEYDGPGTPDVVDFGGGFPALGASPTPGDFAAALRRELDRAGLRLPPTPAIEPGRAVVGAAGWLVASVLHTRMRGEDRQVILDAGMTELIRPALYGSRHRITALSAGASDGVAGGAAVAEVAEVAEVEEVIVHGAVCESTDTFGTHPLPPLRRGDLVVLHETGAYGASFSSRYNGRPPAPEVLLRPDGSLELAPRMPPPDREWPAGALRNLTHVRSGAERKQS